MVHIDRAKQESERTRRVSSCRDVYTGIWWYGRFPNHYSGDGSVARAELGQWNLMGGSVHFVALRAVKADDASLITKRI